MDNIDCIVIGGGVVGLAVARQICGSNLSCVVVDSSNAYGQGISSRNSEVIHGGIYYPSNTLKSKFCVRGKKLLYDYCIIRNVAHQKCGKIIVATSQDDENRLEGIAASAQANGVEDLSYLSKRQIKKLEPLVRSCSGLLSPSTGIIDSHQFMTSLVADIEFLGGYFVPNSRVKRIVPKNSTYEVTFDENGADYTINANFVVNSAGLSAQSVAHSIEGLPKILIPELHLCKGTYFALSAGKPFNHLIYPVPSKRGDGLGVHSTIDMDGNVKFGPDVEYIDHENYFVDDARIDDFYQAISQYFPSIVKSRLHVDYCGLRPKLQGPKDGPKDFEIQDLTQYGFPGLVQLFGIESPGLTSSLAIAEYVGKIID